MDTERILSLSQAVSQTAQILGKIFDKPTLSEKNLSKPRFRFIHDVVSTTLGKTGFPADFFNSEELDPEAASRDKCAKVEFLQKLIFLVQICRRKQIDVRSSKIVSGLEAEKTNILLSEFGLAALDKELNRELEIKNCLQILSNSGTSTASASLQFSEGPAEHSDSTEDLKRIEITYDDYIKTTKHALEGLINKPWVTESHLRRPSVRFLYDIIMTISSNTGYGMPYFSKGAEEYTKLADKKAKLCFFQNVINHVQASSDDVLDIRASKMIAGKECDKTLRFLQVLVLAAKKGSEEELRTNKGEQSYIKRELVKGSLDERTSHASEIIENEKKIYSDHSKTNSSDNQAVCSDRSDNESMNVKAQLGELNKSCTQSADVLNARCKSSDSQIDLDQVSLALPLSSNELSCVARNTENRSRSSSSNLSKIHLAFNLQGNDNLIVQGVGSVQNASEVMHVKTDDVEEILNYTKSLIGLSKNTDEFGVIKNEIEYWKCEFEQLREKGKHASRRRE